MSDIPIAQPESVQLHNKQLEPSIVESVTPLPLPRHSFKRLLIIVLVIFALLISGAVVYFLTKSSPSIESNNNVSSSPTSLTVTQKIGNLAKSVIGVNPSSSPVPSVTPAPSPIQSSIDEIISTSGYTNKQVDYTDNSGPTLDNTNLKIKIPGQQSRLFIPSVFAAELQSLYPIYLQNPEITTLSDIAVKLGLQAHPSYPDNLQKFNVEYSDSAAKLTYNPTSHGTLRFEAIPGTGDLPSTVQAQNIATTALRSIGISLDSLEASVIESSISSIYENFASIHPALAVNYFRTTDGYPVVIGDTNSFNNNPFGLSLSPIITAIITGGGKIARIEILDYGQYLGKDVITMNSRSLDSAVEELKIYGGHIRNITELEGQRTYFGCANNICDVHNATITKAQLNYYWNNTLPSLSFAEINDNTPRAFEYLIPVWTFDGTGTIEKSKTDESGKLIPNPDKSNPDEYYIQNVKFVATIPAFSATNEVNLLSAKNYTLTKTGDHSAKVTFDTLYHFPTFNSASFMNAEPRNGIKYKLLILFPDKTYTVIHGYKQEVYQGEIDFPLPDQTGTITTYLELSDFSNLIEKRTLQVD